MKFESNARWPVGTFPSGNDVTTDKHGSHGAAAAVCRGLDEKGWGGEGKIFPLKTWVSVAQEKTGMLYLLRKHGMWYAHNNAGYTARAELAEIYTKEYAEKYAQGHDDVFAIPLNEAISSADQIQPYIDRLEKMQMALTE